MCKKNTLILFSFCLIFFVSCQNEEKSSDGAWKNINPDKTEQKVIIKGVEKSDEVTLEFAATSDIHGHAYAYDYAIDEKDSDTGLSKTTTVINQLRKKNPNLILMDTGDLLEGNSADLFNKEKPHPLIDVMNEAQYDLWVLGNHEFNFGLDFLTQNINASDANVVVANIYKTNDNQPWLLQHQIFNIEGVRVAFIGATTPHITTWEAAKPEHTEGLEFRDPLESVREQIDTLEGQYDILVGGFHLGSTREYDGKSSTFDIANNCPEFDLIFHGHEHSRRAELINGIPVLEPGWAGWAVSHATIEMEKIDGSWIKKDVQFENILTEGYEEDPEILEIYADSHVKALKNANVVVGNISDDFINGVDYITKKSKVTTMPTAQIEDTALIDFINSIQIYYAKSKISGSALFNFDSNLIKGVFKRKDVNFIYKYTNTLYGVNITGENLLKYMEWSVSYYNTWKPGDITISFNEKKRAYNYDMFSGLNYEINLSKETGDRIENVTIDGEEIVKNKTYKLSVNDYRYNTLLKNNWITPDDMYYDSNGVALRDLIVNYIENVAEGKITPKVDYNWKITGVKLDYPGADDILEKVKSGEIIIPTSKDGRTPNVHSLTIYK